MQAFTDGACRGGNPGQTSAAFAVFLENATNDLVYSRARYLGPELRTNNFAEYQGLLDLLKWACKSKVMELKIFCDSKLVVNQVMDEWDVNSQDLMPLWREAYALRIRGNHTLHHIHGHSGNPGNDYVDRLCNEVLDRQAELDVESHASRVYFELTGTAFETLDPVAQRKYLEQWKEDHHAANEKTFS